ncbi:bromodomain containing 7/9 isoform X1 [Rhodnius prolixus]|uniref:bromodomain containing 7/9 isoform X1 n=1 Tax=Rhodnius prolixus TaxID=13249 RepID=UPI003D18AA3E
MDVPPANVAFGVGSGKKHKRHKKEKYEEFRTNTNANGGLVGGTDRGSGLKLILKVGSSSTPEHHPDSPAPSSNSTSQSGAGPPPSAAITTSTTASSGSLPVGSLVPIPVVSLDDESCHSASSSFHKKAKKKKKKKDKDHDKKRRHHHKKKKKYEDQSSQDGVSIGEESMVDSPQVAAKEPLPATDDQFMESVGSPREPRLCVQLSRQKASRTPLQKTLDYLQVQLEKKDPQQFFAWPVTDQIAPGYSLTISRPMDFSTMKQKIDDNAYPNLTSYINDLKLMCNNAMVYNQPDTIYYKAAKRLLHGGLKLLTPERLKQALPAVPALASVPYEQLGFSVGSAPVIENNSVEEKGGPTVKEEQEGEEGNKKRPANFMPESKFEAIPDDMTPEQILEQAQKAALASAEKLSLKKIKTNMGFLRQQQDGSTSLAIFVAGDGIDPEKPRLKPVTIGQLIGRLTHGTGQLHGFREDRRNIAKTVKPLNYGAFGSYAPSYDSTFANLSKEESDLLYETYGDENATLYAESVLNFAKDCDYTLTMVDNLLDLLTAGEHRKSKAIIDEQRRFREEEEKVRELMEGRVPNSDEVNIQNLTDHSQKKTDSQLGKMELAQLKSLSDLGIDISFLNEFEGTLNDDQTQTRQQSCVQEKLEQTSVLLEKLQQVQSDRLSAPPPPHLSHILQPSDTELNLAEKITESLTELAKQVPPGAIIAVPAIRKAMGVVSEPPVSVSTATNTTSPLTNPVTGGVVALDGDSSGGDGTCPVVGQLDLESELRELLESDTALSNFPLHDDKTIEEMLSEP